MTAPAAAAGAEGTLKPEEKRVIFASSLGTVFEWYDFYLYATLAPFFAALFFPTLAWRQHSGVFFDQLFCSPIVERLHRDAWAGAQSRLRG